jgi:hypothetical protein
MLLIEEPEQHLHPRQQAALGDILIRYALDWHGQIVVETHSEHLILRILRRIRETTAGEMDDWPVELMRARPTGIRPEDVSVLYVIPAHEVNEPGHEGAKVIELPIDANGEFTCEWPGGFFEERMKELF